MAVVQESGRLGVQIHNHTENDDMGINYKWTAVLI